MICYRNSWVIPFLAQHIFKNPSVVLSFKKSALAIKTLLDGLVSRGIIKKQIVPWAEWPYSLHSYSLQLFLMLFTAVMCWIMFCISQWTKQGTGCGSRSRVGDKTFPRHKLPSVSAWSFPPIQLHLFNFLTNLSRSSSVCPGSCSLLRDEGSAWAFSFLGDYF